ncbi:MAG: thiol:disulfide interchange protein, partial [Paramuribaculum sp.]|nr:thiol:disulfide interchange protein [Paramuribaculum sp.]
MKKIILMAAIVLSALASSLNAQILNPIKWEVSSEMTSSAEGVIRYAATIESGWHLYGTSLPEGGPKATSISYDRMEGLELVGDLVPSQTPVEKIDKTFNLKLNWWESNVVLTQKFRLKDGGKGYAIAGVITFQGCNDGSCIPPTRETFEVVSEDFVAGQSEPAAAVADNVSAAASEASSSTSDWWKPVVFPDNGETTSQNIADSSWWYIFIWGFIGGLVALLTPCVWPMIPLTVSFFLKKNGSKGKSVRDAVIYGGGII